MSLNDYKIIQEIGNQEESSLFKVRKKKDGLIYLLKKVDFYNIKKKVK